MSNLVCCTRSPGGVLDRINRRIAVRTLSILRILLISLILSKNSLGGRTVMMKDLLPLGVRL